MLKKCVYKRPKTALKYKGCVLKHFNTLQCVGGTERLGNYVALMSSDGSDERCSPIVMKCYVEAHREQLTENLLSNHIQQSWIRYCTVLDQMNYHVNA